MASEREIQRSAQLLISQYGDDAFKRAEQRAAGLKAKADLDGWATWVRIAAAVLEMQAVDRKK